MSGKRNPVPREAVDYWLKSVSSGEGCNQTAAALIGLFPARFGHLAPDGVAVAIRREMRTLGLEAPDGNALRWSVPESHKGFVEHAPELVFDYVPRLLVFSDPHFPLHDEEGFALLLRTIESLEYKEMLWCGDSLDNGYRGHKNVRDVYAPSYKDGLLAMAQAHDMLTEAGIERSVIVFGNHDQKVMRGTDGEFTWKSFWEGQLWPLLRHKTQHWDISERYQAVMKPAVQESRWPFVPENFPTRFTHQKNYSSVPLSVARSIAGVKLQHVVTGHQHHLCAGMHQSNLLFVADAGTGQDFRLAGYKEVRDTRHPEWTPGFLTIDHGSPTMWAYHNTKEWWEAKWQGDDM